MSFRFHSEIDTMAAMLKGWSLYGWTAAVSMLLPACGLEYAVRLRADEDLHCPDEQIEVENDDGPTDYVARGCGSEQQYTCGEDRGSVYCWKRD